MINFDDLDFFKGLNKFSDQVKYRYCIPGHDKEDEVLDYISKNLTRFDVTETIGTDDLNYPESFIKKSLDELAEIYGVRKTFISVNGSSGSLINAILSVTYPKDTILLQRDCHKSVFNASILGDLQVEYINPEYDARFDLNLGISVEKLENYVENRQDIKALLVTYPSINGICCDIKGIANVCHRHDILLIVDEAHGSHLRFSDKLPLAAEKAGADIVVQSMHKTLPAMTQTSLLHVCSERVDIDRVAKMFKLTITSSPSYIFMASIVAAVHYMNDVAKKKLADIVAIKNNIINNNPALRDIMLDRKIVKEIGAFDFDETRPIASLYQYNMSGNDLELTLRKKYGIALEYSDFRYVIGYFTVNDDKEKIEYFCKALLDVNKELEKSNYVRDIFSSTRLDFKYPSYKKNMDMRPAFYSKDVLILVDEAVGETSADFIIPYPPGIPLVCPGEEISQEIVDYIHEMHKNNNTIYGVYDKKIRIVQI